ncbi:hypothetical protein CK203_053836 [Vitis vinifera]|uniref:Uncharacterized protein n=1 Tax=Vitis vinifera TaxID=29760 RepID=A0A438GRK1_VITVI|nr:hypothetical protein CK203_053836 [Vitis vinifera]
MAPATELARELELEPVMESEKALEIAQSGQWVLSFQPLASFAVADPLTWLLLRLEGEEDLPFWFAPF